ADRLDIGRKRHLSFLDQEKLVLTNVFGAELVGRLAEVPGELADAMQVNPDSGGRIFTDLGSSSIRCRSGVTTKAPFVVTRPQNRESLKRDALPYCSDCRRLSCVLGMLSSLEVQVLRPT